MEVQKTNPGRSESVDLEVSRFLEEMVRFVEARKPELAEEDAIDEFLSMWRTDLIESECDRIAAIEPESLIETMDATPANGISVASAETSPGHTVQSPVQTAKIIQFPDRARKPA